MGILQMLLSSMMHRWDLGYRELTVASFGGSIYLGSALDRLANASC